MKVRTLSGERTVHFPQTPPDGYQHTEHNRTWQWVADPGMWRSVSGGIAGGEGGPVDWDDVQDKPDSINSLAAGIIIGGSY